MATVVVQILLMVGWLDVDGSAQSTLLDVNIDIQEGWVYRVQSSGISVLGSP